MTNHTRMSTPQTGGATTDETTATPREKQADLLDALATRWWTTIDATDVLALNAGIRALRSHDALVEALQSWIEYQTVPYVDLPEDRRGKDVNDLIQQTRAALKKAGVTK